MTKKFFWFPEAKFRNPEFNGSPQPVREKETPSTDSDSSKNNPTYPENSAS